MDKKTDEQITQECFDELLVKVKEKIQGGEPDAKVLKSLAFDVEVGLLMAIVERRSSLEQIIKMASEGAAYAIFRAAKAELEASSPIPLQDP